MRGMENVLTLVGNATARDLSSALVATAAEALSAAGAQVGDVDWLAQYLAADLPFTGLPEVRAMEIACAALGAAPIDLAAQKLAQRRKRLLMADMDSTTIQSETMDDLAAIAGIGEQVAAITARTMRGELPFEESLRKRVAMLAGHSWQITNEVVRALKLSPGARTLVRSLRAKGCYTVLCSGGFTFCTEPVADLCGFHEHHANTLLQVDGKLTGKVMEPILGREAKVERLQILLRQQGVTAVEVAAVGDGANDIAMLQAVGLGVAYRGKPAVRQATPYRIDHSDLTALAYFLGIRESELVC